MRDTALHSTPLGSGPQPCCAAKSGQGAVRRPGPSQDHGIFGTPCPAVPSDPSEAVLPQPPLDLSGSFVPVPGPQEGGLRLWIPRWWQAAVHERASTTFSSARCLCMLLQRPGEGGTQQQGQALGARRLLSHIALGSSASSKNKSQIERQGVHRGASPDQRWGHSGGHCRRPCHSAGCAPGPALGQPQEHCGPSDVATAAH